MQPSDRLQRRQMLGPAMRPRRARAVDQLCRPRPRLWPGCGRASREGRVLGHFGCWANRKGLAEKRAMRLGRLGRARWAPRAGPRVRCWAEMACTQYSSGTVYLFFLETVYFIFDEFELILMSNSVQILIQRQFCIENRTVPLCFWKNNY